MIESTAFGVMTIDGRTYSSDLIIFPDGRVQDGWWRKRGHVLSADDILALVDAAPKLIVAGTGTSSRMRPESGLMDFLKERDILMIAEPNPRAIEMYNRKIASGVETGACFHLTC
ncbi:MTH938/NDUFAF3 family protein [uncultured Desulfosarcina sp.]|uniref:Mth938-like domain-containing protein n=1 Tax=uncultured Desulfosarcina sp. TaxID=218289 RepID=UPI0029C642EA|nr:MTH938/NDUFAF3 family protein [uncultured Desulfosarcina sp.]